MARVSKNKPENSIAEKKRKAVEGLKKRYEEFILKIKKDFKQA